MRRARRGDGCTPHRDDWPTVSATRPELAHATPTPSPAHARSPSQLVTWALAVRSALVVVFEGKSEWGWGNLLPAVFAVHWMCMHAGRYCYVQVQDQELGSVLGYANGASWDAPLKQLKHEYGAFARIRRMDKPWLSRASWGNLTDQLRGHPAPLLLLHFRQQLWLDGFDKFLPFNLPLLVSSNAPAGTPFHLANRTMDRCFCRCDLHPVSPTHATQHPSPARRHRPACPDPVLALSRPCPCPVPAVPCH